MRTMKTQECPTTQKCRVCGELLPLDMFSFVTRDQRHATICKPCNNERAKRRHAEILKDPAKTAEQRAKTRAYGASPAGREADRRKYQKHGHKQRAKLRKRYAEDPQYREAQKARKLVWQASEKGAEFRRRNYEKHRDTFLEFAYQRHRKVKAAMPPWYDKDAVIAVFKEARRLTEETGVPHEVDHIVPLRGKTVSGLHCQQNLQILTKAENRAKWNGFDG